MNATLDTTLDNTLPKELMAIEIEDLKSQNKALQKELDALRPIHQLFKRVPNKTGRGGHYQISDELNSIGLRAMTHGCVSAKGMEIFCQILAEEFPVLLKPLSDEPAKFHLPSDSHFCNLRSDLDYITTKQSDEFIANSTTLFLTTDDTTTSREAKSLHGTGLINEAGIFHSFKNKLTIGSSAEDKENHILEVLTPDIMNKLGGVVADTLASQKLASKRVLAKVAEKTGRDDLPKEQINCMLHTKSNKYKFIIKEIHTDDGKSLLSMMDKHLEILFGSRIGTGYHKQSLRSDLEAKLKLRNLRKPGTFFKCRIGSRIGTEFHNAVALIAYKDQVLECVNEQIAYLNDAELKKTKSKQIPFDQRQNTRFHQVRDMINNEWRPLTMQLSLAIISWTVMIEPLAELDSIKTPLKRLKELINLVDEKFNRIFNLEDAHFEELRRMNIRSECSQTVKDVLQTCEQEWMLATDLQKKELDQMTLRAFRSAYVKFRKDVNDVLSMEDSDAIVPLSNKHQESFFAHYKRNEHLYLHMTDGMIEIVAKAKLNKVNFLK